MPGGGAEILHDDVRRRISNDKADGAQYLAAMESAWKTAGPEEPFPSDYLRPIFDDVTTSLAALYLHFGPFSKYVSERIREAIAKEEVCPSEVAAPPPPVQHRVTRPLPASHAG